jgi:hypothetical protein
MAHLPTQVAQFLEQTGRRGAKTLSFLGKYQGIAQAFNTDAGKEILKHAVILHEELAHKVLEETATPEERIERKVLFKLIETWSGILNQYYDTLHYVEESCEKK